MPKYTSPTVTHQNSPTSAPKTKALLHPWLFLLTLLFTAAPTPSANAQSNNCIPLFQKGKLLKAASCFLAKAKRMPPIGQLSLTQRYTKGRYLKNAAQALRAAAKRSGVPLYQAYLREHALRILQQYLDEKLHENQIRLLDVLRQKRFLLQQIQYATLTVMASESITVCLRGYKYKKCHAGKSLTLKLRPGQYQVIIKRPPFPSKTNTMQLDASSRRTIDLRIRGVLVSIRSTPPDSTVSIDGVPQGRTPLEVRVKPGSHQIRISKPCYLAKTIPLQVSATQSQSMLLQLSPAPPKDPHKGRRILGLSGVIVGGAVLGFGLLAQGLSASNYATAQEYANLPSGTPLKTFEIVFARSQEAAPRASMWQTTALISFGVGGVGLGLGLYWLLTTPPPPKRCR